MMPEWHGVSYHGALTVVGTDLKDQAGRDVILRGMSSHGMQWYPHFARRESINITKQAGANVFRIAMYTDEGGYLSDHRVEQDVVRAVNATLALDMYAIIDWHINYDNNPMEHVDEAAIFFDRMSRHYKDAPGVIYEICNEPNGQDVTWANSVKPYAERIIPVIRKQSPKALILVGSSTWSQDVDICAADPLDFDNLMYTLHFYAGTHGEELRSKCLTALGMGAPIFASEWGTSAADGNGGVYIKESNEWLAFLAQHRLSWCNWSLADRNETSAALLPGAPISWSQKHLSQSGRFVFERLKDYLPD